MYSYFFVDASCNSIFPRGVCAQLSFSTGIIEEYIIVDNVRRHTKSCDVCSIQIKLKNNTRIDTLQIICIFLVFTFLQRIFGITRYFVDRWIRTLNLCISDALCHDAWSLKSVPFVQDPFIFHFFFLCTWKSSKLQQVVIIIFLPFRHTQLVNFARQINWFPVSFVARNVAPWRYLREHHRCRCCTSI